MTVTAGLGSPGIGLESGETLVVYDMCFALEYGGVVMLLTAVVCGVDESIDNTTIIQTLPFVA